MNLAQQIVQGRKELHLTQEALAARLGVTNQAVSKWESEQCCPDILLLPALADVFGITIDQLLGREAGLPAPTAAAMLPWKNDGEFHAVLYQGHTLLTHTGPEAKEFTFTYQGDARNVNCACNLSCGDVEGDASAGGSLYCGDIGGNATAAENLFCGDVEGHASAGGSITCGDIEGSAEAGGDITCGDIEGNAAAGRSITCGDIGGTGLIGD